MGTAGPLGAPLTGYPEPPILHICPCQCARLLLLAGHYIAPMARAAASGVLLLAACRQRVLGGCLGS